jgi:hypothetical protein
MFSNTLSLSSSLNVRDQVLHPYWTTGKVIVLHILIFKYGVAVYLILNICYYVYYLYSLIGASGTRTSQRGGPTKLLLLTRQV